MGLSGCMKAKQKTLKHLNSPCMSLLPHGGSSVVDADPSQPHGANCGMHQQGPEATSQVSGGEPWLVQNTVSTNCGG